MKTETISVVVMFEIEHERKKGARQHCLDQIVRELPIELWGCNADLGSYRIKRGSARLAEEGGK